MHDYLQFLMERITNDDAAEIRRRLLKEISREAITSS